jgi:hypothetical protein
MESLADHELKNWSRWANSGPSDAPKKAGSCLGNICIPDTLTGYVDESMPPIHEENAKRVQKVYDFAITIERKILQAEYLSPWQYKRYSDSGGVPEAVRRINAAIDPSMKLSVAAYETILASVKRRVERVFT